MATRRSFSDESDEDWKEFLTCSVCLEIFRSPKLLPCHHSFCLPCLEGLDEHHGSGSFRCPQCRRDVTVPSGGVAAFPSNFHLNPKDLEKTGNAELCSIHPKHDMEFYCVDCQKPICSKCVLTDHELHTTKDLDKSARRTVQQLKGDEVHLQKAVSCMEDRVKAKKTDQQSMQDKELDWKEFLTCSLCLRIFRSPKLLPCHHSFCLSCLEDLASRHGSDSLRCPKCGRSVTVPSGGVAAFQSNFHLNPKDLKKARNEEFWSNMECYCVNCQGPVAYFSLVYLFVMGTLLIYKQSRH